MAKRWASYYFCHSFLILLIVIIMKNKQIKIIHKAATQQFNPEASERGEAADVLNMRQRDRALEAVGMPVVTGHIPQGATLLCVDGDRLISLYDNRVLCNGSVIATPQGDVLDACVSGNTLVISTSQGLLFMQRTAQSYVELNPDVMPPVLHFAAVDAAQLTTQVDGYEFSTPYSRWQAPLGDSDLTALTRIAASAHKTLEANAASAGFYTAPVLCRYAVRAFDDTYLWVSQPVLVGAESLAANYRATATVQTSSNAFTGIAPCTASRTAFKLGITVLSGVPQQWQSVVKAIDVFVTDSPAVIQSSTLDYRCSISTVGSRIYLLEFGPQPQSRSVIARALLHARWRRIPSTSHLAELDGGTFVTDVATAAATRVFPDLSTWVASRQFLDDEVLDGNFFASVHRNVAHHAIAHSILSHNGRLHVGGCSLQAVNPWHPAAWFAGTITQQPCHIATAISLKTAAGPATLVRHDDFPYTPQALNPCLSTVHAHATAMRVEVTTATSTMVCETQLLPQGTLSLAAHLNATLASHALVSGSATIPQSSVNSVTTHNGRVRSHAIDNPFVLQFEHDVSGGVIRALAAAGKPIYSGGLGRYPLYAFTQCGIFALPQNSVGNYGEARLVHTAAIAPATMPVQGDRCIWFVSDRRVLYDLCGTQLTRHLHNCDATQLAWNTVEQELWMRCSDGSLSLLMNHDRTTRLSLQALQLYARDNVALAINAQGELMDITQETPIDRCNVYYRSQPIVLNHLMRTSVTGIVWNIFARQAQLRLSVTGERGASCHGFRINSTSVQGPINAPLQLPLVAQPLRTLRLTLDGAVPSGTLMLPTHLHICDNNP